MMGVTNFPNGISVFGVDIQADWRIEEKVSSAFDGGTTNAHGDHDGTGDPYTLFTVTGVVEMRVFGVCSVDLVGASATIEVGVAGGTALVIAQTTATDIDAGEIWLDATPGLVQPLDANGLIVKDLDIIETVATANITAGQITYYCIWRPISDGATVVAA